MKPKNNTKKAAESNKDPAPITSVANKKLEKDLEKISLDVATLVRDQALRLTSIIMTYKKIQSLNSQN